MWLFVLHSGPANRLAARELTDMALMAALFGQQVRLLLLGDAVLHLFQGDDSPLADLKELLTEPCLVEAAALPRSVHGLESPALSPRPAGPSEVRRLYRDSARVLSF